MALLSEMKIRDTNVEIKKKHFKEYMAGVESQFLYGGKKYGALNTKFPGKESTDYICDIMGLGWVVGQILKYSLRLLAQWREEDMFKIACYTYIMWLKLYSGDHADANRALVQGVRDQK